MTKLLSGKVVMITGASKGIGRASAQKCAEFGADLILVSRDLTKLENLKQQLESEFGIHVFVYSCDVTENDQIIDLFKKINEKKISIDCLLNNAGVMMDATLQVVKPDIVKKIYETNVFSVMYLSQLAMKSMLRKRKGSIINMTSIIGTNGNAGQVVYGSSKSAVIGITKSLAKELAPFQIRVNAIAPGFIDTDMTKNMEEKFKEKNIAAIGMKKIGQPSDIANVVVFLASDLSDYVTGQVIGVDGGMVI